MSSIAVIGAGELGGAVAQRLARLDCVARVLLVDRQRAVAAGMALDIQQSAAIDGFRTSFEAAGDPDAARGASVVVIADPAFALPASAGQDPPDVDPAPADDPDALLDSIARLISPGDGAVVVFAAAAPVALMERALGERRVARGRLVGSAPLAFASAVRALVGASIDRSPAQIALSGAGRPPAPVILWSGGTVDGSPIEQAVGPAALAAVRRRVPALWPPGPLALASAASRVACAIAVGSRRLFQCWVGLDEPGAARGRVGAMPVELGPRGIARVVPPVMSARERVLVDNALERRG